MTTQEFKAWFEGFTESIEGPPSKKQWERIKARVAEIDGAATTIPVFVERYRPWWQIDIPTFWPPRITCTTTTNTEPVITCTSGDTNVVNMFHQLGAAERCAIDQ